VKKTANTYSELVKNIQYYKTPGTPNEGIVPPGKDELKNSDEEQNIY
jgi:hypothetical protein